MKTGKFKSSYSAAAGHCVEVEFKQGVVIVSNSRTQIAPLNFTPEEWKAFIQGVLDGEFDYPSE